MTTTTPTHTWPSRWGWVLALVGGVLAYIAVLEVMLATDNPNFFPSLLLIGSVTVPSAALLFASGGRRGPIAPVGALVLVAIVGGVVGTLTAGVLEYDTLRRLSFLPMLAVGLIEEGAKLIVPALLLLYRPARGWAGVAVGVASATGFATLETMGYGFVSLLASRGDLAAVDATLLLRGLLSPACHIAWTGVTAAMLWRWRNGVAPFMHLLGAYLAAVVLHAVWDATASVTMHLGVAVISTAALLWFIHAARRSGSLTAAAA